jgi:methylated-DNA-[protein]-cysteine S-methyltransferase
MNASRCGTLESPVGPLWLEEVDGRLAVLRFDAPAGALAANAEGAIADELRSYLRGDLAALDRIPVSPRGTAFQLRVWAALRTIPPGQAWTYARLATEVGDPKAVRAVGAANGRNPVALVIPCHRVIASDGTLHGYGGGLERKAWLLMHEGAYYKGAQTRKGERASGYGDRSGGCPGPVASTTAPLW